MVAVGIERETLLLQIEAQLQALVSFCPSEARMQFSSITNLQSNRDLREKLPHLSGKCICGLQNLPNLLCQSQAAYSDLDFCLVLFIRLDDWSLKKQLYSLSK